MKLQHFIFFSVAAILLYSMFAFFSPASRTGIFRLNKCVAGKEAYTCSFETDIDAPVKYMMKRKKTVIRFEPLTDSVSFCSQYPDECKAFKETLKEHKNEFFRIIDSFGLEPEFVLAVAAPEIAWYSSGRDKAETLASEVFYVQLGDDYADFSLGLFQMKPSFIENLEKKVEQYQRLEALLHITAMNELNDNDIRSERIERLKDPDRQLRYLCVFCLYMNEKYKDIIFPEEKDRLMFYATTYNCGLDKPIENILKIASVKLFPSGKPEKSNFAYAESAAWFFQSLKNNDN